MLSVLNARTRRSLFSLAKEMRRNAENPADLDPLLSALDVGFDLLEAALLDDDL